MYRFAVLGFGLVSYAVFFVSFLYLVGFLGNFGVPKSIDSGDAAALGRALLVDTLLLLLFGIQHSVMARPAFKAWWTRFVPKPIERSTYVLATSGVLIAMYVFWMPVPERVWQFDGVVGTGLTVAFLAGVGLVLFSTFLIDHFDLFGVRQVVLHFRGRPYEEKRFMTPLLYRFIRHPLYVGWFLAFWMTPSMSAGHLLFALVMTSYVLVAIPMEESDLKDQLGEPYRSWRSRTPAFVPGLTSRAALVRKARES